MSVERSLAITGLACRFPGAAGSAAFWELLSQGRDAIAPIPPERWSGHAWYAPWPPQPGRSYVREAGVIADVQGFDAAFFGIAPREAEQMDPQQRILLETAWDALEAAGQTRQSLRGSRTGVYIGLSSGDYAFAQSEAERQLNAYWATGNASSIAANRLSYAFDLRGQSLVVDTACSSSLVAVHLACRALRDGEIDQAIVGGANIILSPELMIVFSAARMLAPDARCKTFDARADGYVRGEGCGVIVLKRLADALAQDDPIIAVIRGSAINQDGRSNGLTAPNGQAQQAVIEAALADAGLPAAAIDAVELHGTGTSLGDPIEALALGTVLSVGRPEARPCLVGSVKTNIGHLEAAAGIAGLIKAALALYHRRWPISLNFETANPAIPLAELGLSVATAAQPLAVSARIGVSSFGFGGTNAHVILERAPEAPATAASQTSPLWLLPLSAHTPAALDALCQRYIDALAERDDTGLGDLIYTASVRRTHHEHRLAVIGSDAATLAQGLAQFLARDVQSRFFHGRRPPAGPRRPALWLSTLPEMTGEDRAALLRWSAAFRTHLGSVAPDLAAHALPADIIERDGNEPLLASVQHALVLSALAAEVKRWGLDFASVAGEGIGAIVAGWYRGEASLADVIDVAKAGPVAATPACVPPGIPLLVIGHRPAGDHICVAEIAAPDLSSILQALAQLYAQGHAIRWDVIYPPGRTVRLPAYPWQHQDFWFKAQGSHQEHPAASPVVTPSAMPATKIEDEDRAAPRIEAPEFIGTILSAFPAERTGLIEAQLTRIAASILKLTPDSIDAERGLQDLGMDSLMAVDMRNQIQKLTSIKLSATTALEVPSIRALAAYLLPLLIQPASPKPGRIGAAPRAVPVRRTRQDTTPTQSINSSMLAQIANMSEGEALRRLRGWEACT